MFDDVAQVPLVRWEEIPAVDDLEAERAALVERGVLATEVGDHHGTASFAFSDPEGRWFAVTH